MTRADNITCTHIIVIFLFAAVQSVSSHSVDIIIQHRAVSATANSMLMYLHLELESKQAFLICAATV
jgi:hypothetical protein